MKIWWCEEHESRGNPNLDAEWDKGEHLEMWAGCHDSLWSFASGMGDGGKEDKVGRCRMVLAWMRLTSDNEKTVQRIANAMWVEMLPGETQGAYVHRTAVAILAELDGETP